MTTANPSFVSFLKNSGANLTKQRQVVFELLVGSEPISINELVEKLKGNVDRASIYRIVRLFEELGITQRVNQGWKYKIELSDKFTEHHHHLTCRKCRKVIPINERTLEDFISNVASQYNFVAEDHQVEIQGLCSGCRVGIS